MDNKALTTWDKIKDSEIYFSFIKSPTAIVSSILLAIIFFCSFFVEFITPYNPFDPSSLSLMDAFTPPSWTSEGKVEFLLGTDGQGRDMLSTILYGSRISLIVGFSAILFSLILGVGLGLTAGFFGGKYEMIVMRLTDVQLTVPSILMALLVNFENLIFLRLFNDSILESFSIINCSMLLELIILFDLLSPM